MFVDPTALILADRAQRHLLDTARLDTPASAPLGRVSRAGARPQPRSLWSRVVRLRPAV